MAEKLLTIREVAYILGLSEKEVVELSQEGAIPAYKVGGVYLRFQKAQIEHYKNKISGGADHKNSSKAGYTAADRLRDFFYFYDFYIFSAILIIVLLMIIIKG